MLDLVTVFEVEVDDVCFIEPVFLIGEVAPGFVGDGMVVLLGGIFISNYNIFIIMIKQALCKINDERLLILRRENNVIINKITKGLFYLKNEYKNQETVHAELIKLIEFIETNITF